LAIANALGGMSRAMAAASAGMDRQTLRDWVIRYNEHGVAGLCDRWKGGRPPLLTAESRRSCLPWCWPAPIRRRTASRLSRARTWWRWPRRGSASRCIQRRWAAY
jgi:transposase